MKKWMVALALAWPGIHALVFVLRFDAPPPWGEALWFLPTGMIGAGILAIASGRAKTAVQRKGAIVGFIAMVPFALAGNILGGLAGPIGVTVGGVVPLLIGTIGGMLIGAHMPERDGDAV